MRDLHCKAMPFRPADNSPFRRHYAPMGATRRSLLCLCMCDGFSIAHRRENARIIAEAPPVAEKARRFRGSVPVFTPQRGWKPADTTVFRIAEAPPVAYFSRQFFLFVSDGILFVNSDKKYAKNAARNRWFLDFLSSQELRSLWAVKGIDCATNPLPLPLRRRGVWVYRWGSTDSHDQSADWSRNDRGWQGGKRALSPVGRAPFCMEKYQSLTCSGRLSP